MRKSSGGRRVVRQRLDGRGAASERLEAAVGWKGAVAREVDRRSKKSAHEKTARRGRRTAGDPGPPPHLLVRTQRASELYS
jgi:hypothetical protein